MRPTPPQPLENNVAAYQQVLTQTPEAKQLAFLQHNSVNLTVQYLLLMATSSKSQP